jgi:Abortive infection C-terminus
MPTDRLPNPLIATVASVLSEHFYSHRQIDNLFTRCNAPGPAAPGNLITKIEHWLSTSTEPFALLGCVLENFMEQDTEWAEWLQRRAKITKALAAYSLSYGKGGHIVGGVTGAPSRSLDSIIRERDIPAVRSEFDRALATVERDPPAAVTAACAIIESLCKVYIDENRLPMPADQSIRPLWKVVQEHLGLGPRSVVTDDMKQILGGLATVLNGVGDLRTHAGSAHGRGSQSFTVEPRHARLAVHAAHTVVTFVLESWAPSRPAERMDATL